MVRESSLNRQYYKCTACLVVHSILRAAQPIAPPIHKNIAQRRVCNKNTTTEIAANINSTLHQTSNGQVIIGLVIRHRTQSGHHVRRNGEQCEHRNGAGREGSRQRRFSEVRARAAASRRGAPGTAVPEAGSRWQRTHRHPWLVGGAARGGHVPHLCRGAFRHRNVVVFIHRLIYVPQPAAEYLYACVVQGWVPLPVCITSKMRKTIGAYIEAYVLCLYTYICAHCTWVHFGRVSGGISLHAFADLICCEATRTSDAQRRNAEPPYLRPNTEGGNIFSLCTKFSKCASLML